MKEKGTAATTDEASSNSSKLVDQRSSLVRRVPMFSVACSRLSKTVTRALATRKATWKVHSSLSSLPLILPFPDLLVLVCLFVWEFTLCRYITEMPVCGHDPSILFWALAVPE